MKLQKHNNKKAEYFFRSGLEELGYEKPQIAKILFKATTTMGHKDAASFLAILNKCDVTNEGKE